MYDVKSRISVYECSFTLYQDKRVHLSYDFTCVLAWKQQQMAI